MKDNLVKLPKLTWQDRGNTATRLFQKAIRLIRHENYVTWQDEEKALELFEEALKMDPTYVAARVKAASIYYEQGYLDLAQEYLEIATAYSPANAGIRHMLASVLEDSGELDKAIAQYEVTLQDDPNYGYCRFSLALAYSKKKRFEDALAQWQLYLKCGGQDLPARRQTAVDQIAAIRQLIGWRDGFALITGNSSIQAVRSTNAPAAQLQLVK
jgi:tetratricopeptide (TPR) repeat protein